MVPAEDLARSFTGCSRPPSMFRRMDECPPILVYVDDGYPESADCDDNYLVLAPPHWLPEAR